MANLGVQRFVSCFWNLCYCSLLGLILFPVERSSADAVFTIGNSLTNNTFPRHLDGDISWHVFCGENLKFIFDNPTAHCVATSIPWTEALVGNQYDWVTVQPHPGTTLQQDADIIYEWMQMQPTATFVLHTGWARVANLEADYQAGNPNDLMRHSPEYFLDLMSELDSRPLSRPMVLTRAMDILYEISQDISKDIGPFEDLSELYQSDGVHMNSVGYYLMHNVMRSALGQPISGTGLAPVAPEIEVYLNSKLVAVPEPGLASVLLLTLLGRSLRRKRVSVSQHHCRRVG